MLSVKNIETGYGKKQVLFGVSVSVDKHEIVGVIGPNGSGKSTLLKVICGILPPWKGEIEFEGNRINGSNPARNVGRGITLAPQGDRVFPDLSVMENLQIGGFQLPHREMKDRIEEMVVLFPILKERYRQDAGKLSGGEQQQLSLARALIPSPRLLMLDEPSLGLSPGMVESIFEKISQIVKGDGPMILIVEQKVREVLKICTRVYSLKLGKVAYDGKPETLKENPEILKELFL